MRFSRQETQVRRLRSAMRDAIRFLAKVISLDPQVGFIGFADQEERRYFWMQPGEMTTAKDEIWLERDDQAWGGCGGAWNVVLTREQVHRQHAETPLDSVRRNRDRIYCGRCDLCMAEGIASADDGRLSVRPRNPGLRHREPNAAADGGGHAGFSGFIASAAFAAAELSGSLAGLLVRFAGRFDAAWFQ
jgi:hypothetical protein